MPRPHFVNFVMAACLILVTVLGLPSVSKGERAFNPLEIGKPIEFAPEEAGESIDKTPFVIVVRPNYAGASWVVSIKSGKIIGLAPWDEYNKRWTLFNMSSKYRGFIQTSVGERRKPEHYKQYLWYDRSSRYKGVFIASLGGRPKTPDVPLGELGGNLDPYGIGNIPLAPMGLFMGIDPLKPPLGMPYSIIPRLP